MKKEINILSDVKLSPQDYQEQLKKVQLVSIALESCNTVVKREKLDAEMKNFIKDKIDYEIVDGKKIIFKHEFELLSTKSTRKEFAIKIKCTFSAIFSFKEPAHEDFWKIFSVVNLHINTWPYFRELTQNLTQRMSLPPLTLPLRK